MKKRQPKALVVRFSSLGDVVLCSAFAKKWKSLFPTGTLTFAVYTTYANVLKNFPVELEVLALPKTRLWTFFREGMKIADKFHDSDPQLYDLQGNLRSWSLCRGFQLRCLWKQRRWIALQKTPRQGLARWLSVWLRKDMLGERKIFEEHQKLLGRKDFFVPQLRALPTPAFANLGEGGILLAPDSQHWKKKIPPQLCFDLIHDILQHSFEKLSLVGPENYLDPQLMMSLEEKFPGRIQNWLGRTKIEDLTWIASQHKLCICGNSAWLHISEAVGSAVMSFAGPIVPGFGFSPWRTKSRELSLPLHCRPCTRHGGGSCNQKGELFHACVKRVDWKPALKEFLVSPP